MPDAPEFDGGALGGAFVSEGEPVDDVAGADDEVLGLPDGNCNLVSHAVRRLFVDYASLTLIEEYLESSMVLLKLSKLHRCPSGFPSTFESITINAFGFWDRCHWVPFCLLVMKKVPSPQGLIFQYIELSSRAIRIIPGRVCPGVVSFTENEVPRAAFSSPSPDRNT